MPVTKGTKGTVWVGGELIGGEVIGGKKIAEIDSWSLNCSADVSKHKLRRFLRKLRPRFRHRIARIMGKLLIKWGYAEMKEYE